jgi:tripartite-type tricarboxylate transporter receptor subunit TctC
MRRRMIGFQRLAVSLSLVFSFGLIAGLEDLRAQDFPNKPINLVIPFAAGGSSDLAARTFVHLSPEVLGQPMIIQLKPGGGGAIGTEFVAQAKPDGYNLLFGHTNCNTILPVAEGRSRGPDDMASVCRINIENNIYFVRSDSPFKTIRDMIDWAKANPGKLSFGNVGTWSVTDFEWKWLEQKAGIKTRIVPYNGGGDALIALLGGHIQVTMISSSSGYPHMRAGKLRPLAICGPYRKSDLPNVPSMKDAGYDTGLEGYWKGVLAPKGTPRPIIERLAAGFKKMTENKQVIDSFEKLGNEFNYQGPDEFAKYWQEDYRIYQEMVKMLKR